MTLGDVTKTVFSSATFEESKNFIESFPDKVNVHFASWDNGYNWVSRNDSTYPIKNSSMSYFKYTNQNNDVEEEYYFGSQTLDYFSSHTFLENTAWSLNDNQYSQLIKSNAVYVQPTNDTSNDGYLNILVRVGVLPISSEKWLHATDYYEPTDDNLTISFNGSSSSESFGTTVGLSKLKSSKLIAMLDSTSTSTSYNVKVCGQLSGVQGLDTLSIKAYLIQINDQPYSVISTEATLNFTLESPCTQSSFDVSLKLNTPQRQDISDYSALVLDFPAIASADAGSLFTISGLQLMPATCLSEGPYVFPGWENYNDTQPAPIIQDRVTTKKDYQDGFEKKEFRTAITAWIIVLVLLTCFLGIMIYLVRKGKSVLEAEG